MCWLFLFTSSSTLTFPSFYAFPNLLQPLSRILTHHARSYKQPAPGPRSSMWQPTSTPTTCWMQEEIGWFPFDLKCCFIVLEFIEYCLLNVLLFFHPEYPKDTRKMDGYGWVPPWYSPYLVKPNKQMVISSSFYSRCSEIYALQQLQTARVLHHTTSL